MSVNSVTQASTDKVATLGAVKNTSQTQPVSQDSPPVKTKPVAKDTVSISNAAQAALQEATETSAQTAKEAKSGDIQAKKLLAKQVAAKTATTGSINNKSQEVKGK